MRTLCELKRKELVKLAEDWREEPADRGYLCRQCLRFAPDKKRLCKPAKLERFLHAPPAANTADSSGSGGAESIASRSTPR